MVEPIDVARQIHKHVAKTGGAALRGLGAVSGVNRVTVPGISQDNIIFAAILFAFIVWITSKNELPTYIAFFKPGARIGPLDPTKDTVTATPSTGQQSPNFGGTLTPGTIPGTNIRIPGVPGLSQNPFAGIPGFGGAVEWFSGLGSTTE